MTRLLVLTFFSFLFAQQAEANAITKEAASITREVEGSFMTILSSIGHVADKIWKYNVVTMDKQPVTISNIVIGLLLFVIGLRLCKKLRILIRSKLTSVKGLDVSTREALEKISYYVLLVIMTLLVLGLSNVPLKVFTFVGGALAIGVGFGSQNIISNFISGLILMVERPIKVGDLIEVGPTLGRVINIGARCTHIRTGNNIDMLMPNSSLLEGRVTNWTFSDGKVRTNTSVTVAYGVSTIKVEEVLKEAASRNPHILKDPVPEVFMTGFGDNGMQFEVHFWINIDGKIERRAITSLLHHEIDVLFREHEIAFPSTQRELRLSNEKPIEVKMVQG